ncbi:hypothetical protein FKZ61_022425 [Litorilinea aerophila]|uniref:Polyprenyl synthetase family protein n=1 Tax=Litorilinea aerophila TaxID=1204385 RepID=A0A540VAW2_9CHLR|nr:hypothetical protein [Litorilinea aerophila]MCC9078854.1 hypothetical protein [Litorilinea aerophila]OUC06397.1 hypothetical protein RY27_21290 [Litorilinea aerophila]
MLPRDYQQELAVVEQNLLATVEELQEPLASLVRPQLSESYPLIRAAVVLAAGVNGAEPDRYREARLALATALETLFLALNVHGLLTRTPDGENYHLDKSLIGSTILAGDYCFSRAAQMAARTENAQVVTIFAQALQTVSEGHLRRLFGQPADGFQTLQELLRSGALAATTLIHLPDPARQVAVACSRLVAQSYQSGASLGPAALPQAMTLLPVAQQERWQVLLRWLGALAHNGQAPVNTPSRP